MPIHGVERVLKRNQFYWDSYRLLALSIFLLILLNLSLVVFVFYQRYTFPAPKYFATTPDGRLIQIIPLNVPFYTQDTDILNWAQNTVLKIYSFDYVSYRKSLQDASQYFTWRGHMDFLKALKVSNNLEAVKANKQVVSAEITGPLKLLNKGIQEALPIYTWEIQIPLTITYQNSENQVLKQNGVALMRIERVSFLKYTNGIAIGQLVFQTL